MCSFSSSPASWAISIGVNVVLIAFIVKEVLVD